MVLLGCQAESHSFKNSLLKLSFPTVTAKEKMECCLAVIAIKASAVVTIEAVKWITC